MKYMPAAFRGFIVFRPDPKRYRNRASCVAKAVRTVLIFRKMAALRQYRRMSSPALTASVSCLPSPSRMCVTSPWKWNQVDSNIRRSKSKLRFVSTPTRKNRFCVPLSSNPASISSSRFRRSLRSRWKRDCRRATLAAKSRSEAPSTPSPSEPAPTPMAMGCAAMLSVQHDHREGDDKHRIGVAERTHRRALVVLPIPDAERTENSVDFLRLAGQLEAAVGQEVTHRHLKRHVYKADGADVAQPDEVVVLLVAFRGTTFSKIVADVFLGQLMCVHPQERCDLPRRVAHEVDRDQVLDCLLEALVVIDVKRLAQLIAVSLPFVLAPEDAAPAQHPLRVREVPPGRQRRTGAVFAKRRVRAVRRL
eukprot:scaffold3350_cov268-Pinguiococcus_pyrenoidosus.AAC.39